MKNEFYIDKDRFYQMSQAFFEEGMLREIYSSDKISICNVCNACYMVFNYAVSKLGPIGVALEPKHIKTLIENDNLFNELYNFFGKKEFERRTKILDSKFYEHLKTVKEKTDLNGPYVDLEYEKSITGNLKSR